MRDMILSNDENTQSVWVRVTKPLPTGRQTFGLTLEGYVKFLRPTT